MNTVEALLLGIIQGLTEFLPVSSSGHLVLAEHFLGLQLSPEALLSINVLLHAGTLLALIFVYWRNWLELFSSVFNQDKASQKLLFELVLVSIPAAVAGLLFSDTISYHFSDPLSVATMLAITGLMLIIGERAAQQRTLSSLRFVDVLIIGIAQAFALIPGISRSGSTIAAARLRGFNRQEALDFSFIMAMPVIAGATLLITKDILHGEVVLPSTAVMFTAFGCSVLTSFFAIIFLRKFVVKSSLVWFAPYLFAASLGLVLLS